MQTIVFKFNSKSNFKEVFIFWIVLIFTILNANSQSIKTDDFLEKDLVGEHALTLQWLGWETPGSVEIFKENSLIICQGEQFSKEDLEDFLKIDGRLEIVNDKELIFHGTIITKVNYLNNGNDCVREGVFHFKASGSRKYWRMQEMDSPCDDSVDYVDIYFKKL
jgi:hypothetical protein